ncbi:MAG: acetyl-CoA carboxylase, biotin carboxyl carrier protein [Flavobacteriales bacterium]|nr:acetyl-CoA carboxylase, biotin carboxyl carrier protein [Flavobacteriales bacterium]|tara:strand:+ start:204 stop:725 length:522 start_codon:yes stop_codon:yes gene_type:complete
MNLKQIQELIKFVAKSGATEVDLEIGDVKICIKSPPKGKVVPELPSAIVPNIPVAAPLVAAPPVAAPPVVAPPVVAPPPEENNQPPESTDNHANHIMIKSPIIGTFYRRPTPEKDPFINVGDTVDVGSVVGIVEAMKLFNEIESDVSGTIVKVLVDDMSPVEYDQPLFLVDPS